MTIPESQRVLVTTQETFGYFAERYGHRVARILGAVSSESGEPSPLCVAAVVKEIRRERVPAIVGKNIFNLKLTARLAEQHGVRVVSTLYTDALGPEELAGGTYLEMMRYNARAIAGALQ